MDNKDWKKEKIGALKNEMTHLWGAFFIVGGSSLTLVFSEHTLLWKFLGAVGIIITIIFANAYFIKRNGLIVLIDDLRRDSGDIF
ncbi:hypothetical protein tpqmel_0112 [Candidatus Gastranaerophilus sp. (ex Termes propinquus)]|nr:hypothetical protein tpqmel_0112 [Candidatus Gastranaerophilus sp. (ex Termes propinquus)]